MPAKNKNVAREWFNTIFYGALIAIIFRSFLLEPFNIPSGSISVRSAIAASTNATSAGGYTTSYAYVGTRSSSAKESGASATIGYTSDFEGKVTDTPLVMHDSALSISNSNPCVVMTAKDFRLATNTYIFQAKITYAE